MAWRSSGSNNEEMVDKLKRFGVITSDSLEEGFRCVDRKFFVPQGNEELAHSDQPLKEGNVHISAPHIYGSALQELDLIPNSSTSFLNIGSGTGYVSCIAAQILGPNALNYGVELHNDVIDHCKAALGKWKSSTIEEAKDDVSIVHFMDDTIADIQIIKGNGLNIMKTRGEGVVGFDRIYIGAAVDRDALENITKLLTPGGILVGPVDDDLVKVTRVGVVSKDLEDDVTEDGDSSLTGLNEEFTSQILSGVRFAPLTTSSAVTVIPANVWNPTIQRGYPAEFNQASMQLLMCASSQLVQPLPRVPTEVERTNVASMLPKTLWLEVLSYTHRNWFKPEQNETDYLKRRLREEKLKNANLERARREAEEKCAAAERERSVYKMLARRWQSRLDTLLNEHQEQGNDNAERDLLDLADGIRNDDETAVVNNRNRSALSNLRDILQNINSDDEEDDELGEEEDDMNMDLEENEIEGDELDEDEFASAVEEEEDINEEDVDDDSVMEDIDTSMEENVGSSADQLKPRTVSVSSDDL